MEEFFDKFVCLLCFDENTIFSEEQEKKFRIVELLESAKAQMKDILNCIM